MINKKIQFKADGTPIKDECYLQYEREWLDLRRRAAEFGRFLQSELDKRFDLSKSEWCKLHSHLITEYSSDSKMLDHIL